MIFDKNPKNLLLITESYSVTVAARPSLKKVFGLKTKKIISLKFSSLISKTSEDPLKNLNILFFII